MQWPAITGAYRFLHNAQPGVYDRPPREGSLPVQLAVPLADILRGHTTTPDRCWLGFWNGFAWSRDNPWQASTFDVPNRSYLLFVGPVQAAAQLYGGRMEQSPNLWWPDDRAWCVATEIDLNSTYVGCSDACCDAIAAAPELEALPIDPRTGISSDSDTVNPAPARGTWQG